MATSVGCLVALGLVMVLLVRRVSWIGRKWRTLTQQRHMVVE